MREHCSFLVIKNDQKLYLLDVHRNNLQTIHIFAKKFP